MDILLIVTPLAFGLKIPYVVPLAMGLVGTPVAAIPVACGTAVYFLLHYVQHEHGDFGEYGDQHHAGEDHVSA